jgi:hypothetical protein
MKPKIRILLMCVGALLILGLVASLPPIWSRLQPRLSQVYADFHYALNPPEKSAFTPQGGTPGAVSTAVVATWQALTAQAPTPTPSPKPDITATPEPTVEPSPSATPLPESVNLTGIVHEYQKWNNCGPATLSMGISYWVKGRTQDDTAPVLKPNPRDKNVMPMEMVDYINEHTELSALWRLGGTLDLLKHLVAAGYPVIVEKGFDVAGEGWMGHYELVSGYDDAKERFITQDSYISKDLPVPYAQMEREWRAFANVFVVVYPPEKETELMAVLGQYADPTTSYTLSAEQASVNIYALTDPRDIYFAWYAYGTSLMRLQDYNGAAAAYDASFNAYDVIPEDANRPWRMLWYQTGPYFAYYYTGRMADVINLATHTLDIMSEPVLEESYYWRGLALEASGDVNGAIADYRKALEVHTDFGPALTELERLGVSP